MNYHIISHIEVRMGNRNGLSKGSKIYDIVIDKSLGGDIFKGYVYDSPFNLWKTCNLIDYSTWFANNDWNADAVTQPEINLANDEISLVLPNGMGASQWQGQLHINTDMASSAASNYDFSIFFLSAASHPGVTVKLHPTGDDGNFYCEAKVPSRAVSAKPSISPMSAASTPRSSPSPSTSPAANRAARLS